MTAESVQIHRTQAEVIGFVVINADGIPTKWSLDAAGVKVGWLVVGTSSFALSVQDAGEVMGSTIAASYKVVMQVDLPKTIGCILNPKP